MVVAIDGPAGVGKSTLARLLSEGHNLFNLNSGLFYRAIAVKILDEEIQNGPEGKLIQIANNADLRIVQEKLYLDGQNVENRLRNDRIDHWSSVISTIIPIRDAVNSHLRRIAHGLSLVAEGRDMTTVVFPDAEIKIYLTADPKVRAMRRYSEGTSRLSLAEIEKSMHERDRRDMNKEQGSLQIAKNSLVLDTSLLTINEVYEKVSAEIRIFK